MALATLSDVKRIMRLTDDNDVRDSQLRAALDAVESWAETHLWKISKAGPNVEAYFDVNEDATLQLPADDVVVTGVKVYPYPSLTTSLFVTTISLGLGRGYDVTDNGRLILRPLTIVAPFEGAIASRMMGTYSKVEVYYDGTGVVPRAVSEGIAFLAAGYYEDGIRALAGFTSEKIGDYSYNRGGGNVATPGEKEYVSQAKFFLSPFFKQSKVSVI